MRGPYLSGLLRFLAVCGRIIRACRFNRWNGSELHTNLAVGVAPGLFAQHRDTAFRFDDADCVELAFEGFVLVFGNVYPVRLWAGTVGDRSHQALYRPGGSSLAEFGVSHIATGR